jgi:pimeloyl-ACP methyl ester carboxylesterase
MNAMSLGMLLVAGTLASGAPDGGYPPPGQLINLGGRKLHVYCTGAGPSGRPTVVLEAGAGAFAIDWALVQQPLARGFRVCSYDRAGYGWSDPGGVVDDGERVRDDLHRALALAGAHPPYVMVGASLGSLFVRLYQHHYPAEVVGMVLVDPTHEDGLLTVVDGVLTPIATLSAEAYRIANPPPTEPPPLRPPELQPAYRRLPDALQAQRLWLESRFLAAAHAATPASIAAFNERQRAMLAQLHDLDAANPRSLGDLPLVVLTRGLNADDRLWALHDDLARRSSRSRHTRVPDADHEIHLMRPDVVIEAIKDVVETGRAQSSAP